MTDSLERRIGRMCIVGFTGTTAPEYLLDWLRAGRVGGVILFARNIVSPAQVSALTEALRAAAPEPILIAIDQEGGTVARLRAPHGFTEIPGPMALAAARDGEHHTEAAYRVLGAELRAIGIDWDYAPCVDLAYNPNNASLGTRSFGRDEARVGALAGAAVRGLQADPHRVAGTGKHFPGLGDTDIDTHLALPTVTTTLEALRGVDLQPYRGIVDAGVASVMVTHTIFAALDEALPATLSPIVVSSLLREELGYDGVACTDCMEMMAIADHFGPGESAVLAAMGGIDAILFSHTPAMQDAAYTALLDAARSGRLPESTIDAANRRLAALRAFAVQPRSGEAAVRSEAHRAIALDAARAAITVLPAGESVDLRGAGRVGVVEFPSTMRSAVMEGGGIDGIVTDFAAALAERLPDTQFVIWGTGDEPDEAAHALAASCAVLVIATRSAHLNPVQAAHAERLIASAQQRAIVMALRNPYDASLFAADARVRAVVCTGGDSEPSLIAAADALAGLFVPSGTLPIAV